VIADASLPPGYAVRRPHEVDVRPVTALVRKCQLADIGAVHDTEDDIASAWRTMDLERDIWLVDSADGRLVAVAGLRHSHPTQMWAFAAVLPSDRGNGIGSHLLALVERRASDLVVEAPPEAKVTLGQGIAERNDGARALLERHGYAKVRRFWHMEIDLGSEPPPAEWPAGMRVETLRDGQERAVFDAMEEAFEDHWGHLPHRYDEWRAWNVERASFDPSLWFLTLDGEAIAGVSQCAIQGGQGWVNVLGVRRPWRRRGIGLALLRHSFAEFRRRACGSAVLGVDSENPTGATLLYERAGMRVVRTADSFRKVLRDGVEVDG
jgi:ribosomal protein S18 acetylase RimI-like enzyme